MKRPLNAPHYPSACALAMGLLALVAGSTSTATAASPANATEAATPGLAAGESDYLQWGGLLRVDR